MRGHRVADAPVPAADQVLGLEAAGRMRRGGLGRASTAGENDVGPRPVKRLHGVVVEGTEPDHRRGAGAGQGLSGRTGRRQVHPVALWLNEAAGTIDIGGPALGRSQKVRNVQAEPRVSLVVDDQAATPNPIGQTGRGVEVRGQVEIVMLDPPLTPGFSSETLRIFPHRIIACNIGEFAPVPGRLTHLLGYSSRNVSR